MAGNGLRELDECCWDREGPAIAICFLAVSTATFELALAEFLSGCVEQEALCVSLFPYDFLRGDLGGD